MLLLLLPSIIIIIIIISLILSLSHHSLARNHPLLDGCCCCCHYYLVICNLNFCAHTDHFLICPRFICNFPTWSQVLSPGGPCCPLRTLILSSFPTHSPSSALITATPLDLDHCGPRPYLGPLQHLFLHPSSQAPLLGRHEYCPRLFLFYV